MQLQFHRADRSGRLVDIDRRLRIERDRAGHDQLRCDTVLAGLAPFDAACARLCPNAAASDVLSSQKARPVATIRFKSSAEYA